MSELTCLKCHAELEETAEACPHCGDKVTQFQRNYAGRLIDAKYEIVERLGVGGMGEIFKVRHIHLNEQRVIKIMRANIASDDDALQRFLHEAKLATMIKHRNLAMLYDFSTLDDGSYYMVWEFIDGVNIQKWISKNGPVPPRLAVEIAIQALSGLEALHQMGIIHRDISPENIMLSQDYKGGLLAKVIDFGIAKQLSDGEGGQGLTQTGMFLGKLKYASPEQAGFIKEGERLDERSDLYSFGIVLYEMLAGRAPFMATNPQSYILKHATEKPPSFALVNPNVTVPAVLEAVVMKSLEKDRDQRQANTGEFVAELDAIRGQIPPDAKFGLGERMITITPPSVTSEARRQRTGSATRPAPTVPGRPQTSTRSAAPTPTLSGQRTVMTAAEATPTLVESVRSAAPSSTLLERTDTASPTLLEQKAAAAPKKRAGIFAGIAAGISLVAGGGIYLALQDDGIQPDSTPAVVQRGATAGETATVSAASVTPTLIDPSTGVLEIFGGPYDRIARIESLENNKAIELSASEDLSLPYRTELPAGKYRIKTRQDEQVVEVHAGKRNSLTPKKPAVDLDKVVDDVLREQ